MTSGGTAVVRVAEIGGRGRGLVATQPLRAGQVVLRDSPLLLYSALPFIQQQQEEQQQVQSSYCDHCFKILPLPSVSSSQQKQSCPWCSQHHFCSPNCLTVALSSSHSPWTCQSLTRLRESPSAFLHQPSERQVQARFLIAAYNLAVVSPSHFQLLLSLQGNESPPSDAPSVNFLHSLISSSLSAHPRESVTFSLELTAVLLTKDKLNAFGLMEPFSALVQNRSVRAYGIYPMASFFNHDCLPNACRFDYVDSVDTNNTDIIVRMIHDVPQGREICLSYFPVNLDYSTRQKRLLEDYGFTCDCDRCKVEANWSDNDNDGENNEEMDEDEDDDESMVGSDVEQGATGGDSDFPHAYFFLKYMCNRENCWGTLAPLPPSDDNATPSNVLECNVCGTLKHDDDEGEDNLSMDD